MSMSNIEFDRVYWSRKLWYADNCFQFTNSNNKCSCIASGNCLPIYNSTENWKLMLTNFRNLLNRFGIIQEHVVLWTVFFSSCCCAFIWYPRGETTTGAVEINLLSNWPVSKARLTTTVVLFLARAFDLLDLFLNIFVHFWHISVMFCNFRSFWQFSAISRNCHSFSTFFT